MFTHYPISLIDMGCETYVWKCKFCDKLHVWNKKSKYCNCCDYQIVKKMNEKQTAFELVKKHLKYAHTGDDDYVLNGAENDMHNAKKCALITVNELQEFITKYDNHMKDYMFWQEVKQEIIKL